METNFLVELTARNTPLQNSKAETAFTIIVAQARSMLIAAQIPDKERFKLWPEVVMTATFLNNLVPVILNGETKTRWEHASHKLPLWVKNLRTFGEAGTIKEGKKGKVLDRGVTMMFLGYNNYHSGNCYCMYNPVTSRVVITQDAIWLGRMFYARQASHNLEKMPIVSVPINMNVIEVKNDTKTIEITTRVKTSNSKEREGTTNVSSEKSEDWATARTRFGREVGRKLGTFDPATGTTVKWLDRVAAASVEVPDGNNYDVLGIDKDEEQVFEESHYKVIKYINVGAGVGGGFSNTQEHPVMKYHEAINGPDGELWKEEVKNEHKRMIDSRVFKPVNLSKVPDGVKLIDTTWAMKKKSSGTL